MATLNQIIRKPRKKINKSSLNALEGNPQKKGVCIRTYY